MKVTLLFMYKICNVMVNSYSTLQTKWFSLDDTVCDTQNGKFQHWCMLKWASFRTNKHMPVLISP